MKLFKMKNTINICGVRYFTDDLVIVTPEKIMIINNEDRFNHLTVDTLKWSREAQNTIKENASQFTGIE